MLTQLVVIAGMDQGRSIPLVEGQTLVLGRSEAAAVRLTDPRVSRKPCGIEVDGCKFVMVNYG